MRDRGQSGWPAGTGRRWRRNRNDRSARCNERHHMWVLGRNAGEMPALCWQVDRYWANGCTRRQNSSAPDVDHQHRSAERWDCRPGWPVRDEHFDQQNYDEVTSPFYCCDITAWRCDLSDLPTGCSCCSVRLIACLGSAGSSKTNICLGTGDLGCFRGCVLYYADRSGPS